MKFLILQFFSLLLVIGCSTKQTSDLMPPMNERLPPNYQLSTDKDLQSKDHFLKELLQPIGSEKETELSTRWWAEYKRAMIWSEERPNTSCKIFSKLSEDKLFPLRRLALLRSIQHCEWKNFSINDEKALSWVEEQPWLKRNTLDVSITLNTLQDNKENLLKLYHDKSKLALPMPEKIQLTRKALKIAQDLKDQEMQVTLQNRVFRLAPSEIPHPKKNQYLKVAKDFRSKRLFDQARSYYQRVLTEKGFNHYQKLIALKGIRKSYKLQLNKESYIRSTENLFAYSKKIYKRNKRKTWYKNQFYENGITLARTYWTRGRNKQAKSSLKYIIRQLKKKVSLTKAYWVMGRMAEEEGQFEAAAWWFKQALNDAQPKSSLKEPIQWLLAWNLKKLKDYNNSNLILGNLILETESQFNKSRYQFWLAKNLKAMKQDNLAQKQFEELIKEDPVGYYGIVARRENQMVLSRVGLRSPASLGSDKLSSYYNVVYLEWLISVGETEVARDYLDHVTSDLKKQNINDEKLWLSLLNNYARAGQYLNLFYKLNDVDPEVKNKILYAHPGLIFPRPYKTHVSDAAVRFGLSPEFIYSIMRQESAFNPYARSHADAFGLMQLLPEVAQKSAKKSRIPYSKPLDLYKPHINIQLGTSFLRNLYDKYDGQFILAVASYNASEEAINNWMRTRYRGDTVEFIEDIPYEETKSYVRLVLRNMVYYTLFNSKDSYIKFPEWMLELSGKKSKEI